MLIVPTFSFLSCSRVNDYWFLVPIFAPFIGAMVGVLVYQLMVGYHLEGEVHDREEAESRQEKERLKSCKVSG